MSYEHDKDAQNCLAQLDSIIAHVLEHKQSIHNLARTAIDKFVYYSDSVFVDKLIKACTVLNMPDTIKSVQYILGAGNTRISRKTGMLTLLHQDAAKRAFYSWSKSKISFEETARQAEAFEKEEKDALKKMRKQEAAEESLFEFQEKVYKNIQKILKKDSTTGKKAEFCIQLLNFITEQAKQSAGATQDRVHDLSETAEKTMIADAQEIARQQENADDIVIS